jgi:hypothetical protein
LLNSVHLEHTNHATMWKFNFGLHQAFGRFFRHKNTNFAHSNWWSHLHVSFWEDHQRYLSKYYPCDMFGPQVATSLRNSQIILFWCQRTHFERGKIFRKCPSRIQKFETLASSVSLPPRPIVTRWGKYSKFPISGSFYNI